MNTFPNECKLEFADGIKNIGNAWSSYAIFLLRVQR